MIRNRKKTCTNLQQDMMSYLYQQAVSLFYNYVKNYDERIEDADFFNFITSLIGEEKINEQIDQKIMTGTGKRKNSLLDALNEKSASENLMHCWRYNDTRPLTRKIILDFLAPIIRKQTKADVEKDALHGRTLEVKKLLGFDDLELNFIMLGFLKFEGILNTGEAHYERENFYQKSRKYACWLDASTEDVHAMLLANGKLHRFNCVDNDFDYTGCMNAFLLGLNQRPLHTQYYEEDMLNDALPWNYYSKSLQIHGEMLKQMISSGNNRKSLNILLYGAPGTGKTSYAKSLAKELGMHCYVVAQSVFDRCETEAKSKPESRFAALQICGNQVAANNAVILIDESDEMLRCIADSPFGLMSMGNKGLLNDSMDDTPVPTIWISNATARQMDPSSRRRFDYSIRFEPLNTEQRIAIWNNSISRFHLEALIDPEMVRKFSTRYAVSAGGINLVLKNLARLSPAKENVPAMVQQIMEQHCELMGVENNPVQNMPAKDYTLQGLNIKGSIGPERIVEAVRNFRDNTVAGTDRPRMNLLLSGVPGSGKTEFVKYLGNALNSKIIVKMGSDLLGKYVGETEQNIKSAFEEAESQNAILFLDEIDGMVQDREHADRNWEVSQVNELLHRMENFNGVFIGATNFFKRLDSAILRRFTFKLEFDYLNDDGKKHFFEHMFQSKLSDAEELRLNGIECLTPGDFRTVRQQVFYLGNSVTNMERLDMLESESSAKRMQKKAVPQHNRIGF